MSYTDRSDELMKTLVSKLYHTITGNDEAIKIAKSKYVTWCLPGLPFLPEDFTFCSKGFIGNSAEEIGNLYSQAFNLSKLLDFIPDPNGLPFDTSLQQAVFTTTQDTISSVYKDVLTYSKVLNREINDEEKQKIEKFRNLISTEEKNPITDVIEPKPGPITVAYNTKFNEYLSAAENYFNALNDAQTASGNDPEAKRRVSYWANMANVLRAKLEAAEQAWISQGYKNDFEYMNSYIAQVTEKNMLLYKNGLQNKFNQCLLNSPAQGNAGSFYFTTLLPGNFATSPGWTKFSFYEGDYDYYYNKEVTNGGLGASGLNFGLFSIGGGGSTSSIKVNSDQKSNNFSATLEFTQVPIVRPWFSPGFFSMRAWDLNETWNLNFNAQKVSGGEENPVGRMVAYSTSALFVRNVEFKADNWDQHSEYYHKETSAGASVGWGPFRISGSYNHSTTKQEFQYHADGGTISIPGMQLIGFVNNIIPKSPNLNPDIKPEDLV